MILIIDKKNNYECLWTVLNLPKPNIKPSMNTEHEPELSAPAHLTPWKLGRKDNWPKECSHARHKAFSSFGQISKHALRFNSFQIEALTSTTESF